MSCGIGTLRSVKSLLNFETKQLIFNSFVQSHAEFLSLYFGMAGTKLQNKISKLQKNGIRIVYDANRFSHSAQIFVNMEVLPISVLHIYNVFKFVYKVKHGPLNETIGMYWKTRKEKGLRSSFHTQDHNIHSSDE